MIDILDTAGLGTITYELLLLWNPEVPDIYISSLLTMDDDTRPKPSSFLSLINSVLLRYGA